MPRKSCRCPWINMQIRCNWRSISSPEESSECASTSPTTPKGSAVTWSVSHWIRKQRLTSLQGLQSNWHPLYDVSILCIESPRDTSHGHSAEAFFGETFASFFTLCSVSQKIVKVETIAPGLAIRTMCRNSQKRLAPVVYMYTSPAPVRDYISASRRPFQHHLLQHRSATYFMTYLYDLSGFTFSEWDWSLQRLLCEELLINYVISVQRRHLI